MITRAVFKEGTVRIATANGDVYEIAVDWDDLPTVQCVGAHLSDAEVIRTCDARRDALVTR